MSPIFPGVAAGRPTDCREEALVGAVVARHARVPERGLASAQGTGLELVSLLGCHVSSDQKMLIEPRPHSHQ